MLQNGAEIVKYQSSDVGNLARLNAGPAVNVLQICVAAIVMVNKNCQGLLNGQSGRVVGYEADRRPIIEIKGARYTLEKEKFEAGANATSDAAVRLQYPIILAFAMYVLSSVLMFYRFNV